MDEIELDVKTSQRILENLLKNPKWSLERAAGILGWEIAAAARVKSGKCRLRMKEVDLLAKATGTQAGLLLFETFDREEMEKTSPGLYDLGLKEVERHREFLKADYRKPPKKRRSPTKAA